MVRQSGKAPRAKAKKKAEARTGEKKRSPAASKLVQRRRQGAKKRPTKRAAKKPAAKKPAAKSPSALKKARRSAKGRVVVLFADDVVVPQTNGFADKPGMWKELRARFEIEALEPMFADAKVADRLERHGRKVNPEYPWPRFRNYFLVYLRAAGQTAELVRELRTWKGIIRLAYEDREAIPAASGSSGVCLVHSGHVDPAPVGVNAAHAWQFVGGVGEGQSCIDVESGWDPAHARLAHLVPPCGTLLCGMHELGGIRHGTRVLGIVCGTNPIVPGTVPHTGCEGIAPGVADIRLASYVSASGENVYDAVSQGIDFLRGGGGGVLLLEYQTEDFEPLEVLSGLRDLVESAKPDVTVIEAAGNGNLNLDAVKRPPSSYPLFRAQGAPDSGAIMVGSAHSAVVGGGEHDRFVQNRDSGSNFGSRVDCYAWGEHIRTPTSGGTAAPGNWCTFFGGTSGAAAIIAGVALVVRGIAQAVGQQLDAAALRDLLRDPNLGTPCTPGARIGSMPDLARIVVRAHFGSLPPR